MGIHVSSPKGAQPPPPQFSADISCVQTARWIKMSLGWKVGLDPSDIVLDGDLQLPLPKKWAEPAPVFDPYLLCLNGWLDQDGNWYGGRSRPKRHRDPAIHPRKGGQSPQFSAHVYCGQTAAWIKMKLRMEVGLRPGHIVLDGVPAPPKSATSQRHSFRPMSIMAKRLGG